MSLIEDWIGYKPEESGVFPHKGGRFAMYFVSPSSSVAELFGDEEQATARLEELKASEARFWDEKVVWMNQGDRTGGSIDPEGNPEPIATHRDALRVDGRHYVTAWEGIRGSKYIGDGNRMLGYGGRVLRWVFLDDPTETVHESNCVWTQGAIPSSFDLPDNARWVLEPETKESGRGR